MVVYIWKLKQGYCYEFEDNLWCRVSFYFKKNVIKMKENKLWNREGQEV